MWNFVYKLVMSSEFSDKNLIYWYDTLEWYTSSIINLFGVDIVYIFRIMMTQGVKFIINLVLLYCTYLPLWSANI